MRPPVSTPVLESSWQNRKLAVASLLFTNAPHGSQFWMRRRYSSTRRSCSLNVVKFTPRAPIPRSAASNSVPGDDTATHIGGGGFWVGFGRPGRGRLGGESPPLPKRPLLHTCRGPHPHPSPPLLV